MATVDRDVEQLWEQFHGLVNMPSSELREWLAVAAEDVPEEEQELGHRVRDILGKRRTDLTTDDVEVMRQVIDRIGALFDSGAAEDRQDPRWRHRLMTLGHDPLQADSPEPDEI